MKTKTLTLFAYFFLCFLFCSWGQENTTLDSLTHLLSTQKDDTLKVLTLNKLSYANLYVDFNKSLKYADEGLRLSEKLNYRFGWGLGNMQKGSAKFVIGQQDSARFFFKKALTVFKELNKYQLLGKTNRNLAVIAYEKGNYETALSHIQESIEIFTEKVDDSLSLANCLDTNSKIQMFQANYKLALKPALRSLKILEKLNEPLWLADALNNIGLIEFYNDNFQKSIVYNERAILIYQKQGEKWWLAQTMNNLGNSYYYLEEYEKAETIINECLNLCEEIENTDVLGSALSVKGKILTKKKQLNKAISNLSKSLEIAEEVDSKNKIAERLNDLGNAYFEKNEINKSIELYSKAIVIADSIGAKNSISNGYLYRSRAYAKIYNFEKAYSDNENLRIVNDSILNKTKSQQIEELKTIYETEKKEQQIAFQEKEIVVLEQEAKISDQQKLLLGGGMSLSLLALGFGFYGFRQKTKRNQLEKDKVEAELAFKKKELTTHALHLAKKNEVLESVKLKAKDLKLQGDAKGYQELIKTINFDQQDDKNWESFTQYFEQVHKNFASNVKNKYPEVTKNELRFMALLKMNLSSKEIATILNISPDGIKKARQRLRKKMSLTPDDSLETTVLAI